jgi:hypothetical protein
LGLYLQIGYGKADRLSELIQLGSLEGVILSPFDETRESMDDTAQTALNAGLRVVMDPQTFVASIPGARPGRLARHGLALPGSASSLPAPLVQDHVAAVVARNQEVGAAVVLAPTPIQRGFQDPNTGISLQLVATTLNLSTGPVFGSCVVDAAALADWTAVSAWLNQVTAFPNLAGIYLVVSRPSAGPYPIPLIEQRSYVNLLRAIHRLRYNDLEVVVGYCDAVEGLGALAAGAHAFGAGWTVTRRFMIEDRWQEGTGGQQPPIRVWLPEALSALRSDEAESIYRDAAARAALGNVGRARCEAANGITQKQGQIDGLHDLSAAARIAQEDPDSVMGMLEEARRNLRLLRSRVVTIDPGHFSRIEAGLRALREFRILEGLD